MPFLAPDSRIGVRSGCGRVGRRMCRTLRCAPVSSRSSSGGRKLMTMSAKVRCGWMKAGLSVRAVLELLHHLLARVAALGGVPLDLPADAQVGIGVEVDLDVVAFAHGARGVAEQALDDDVLLGLDVFRRVELAGAVVVDRLQDRLALAEEAQVLLDDVDVVAARVEGGDADLGAPPARIACGNRRCRWRSRARCPGCRRCPRRASSCRRRNHPRCRG